MTVIEKAEKFIPEIKAVRDSYLRLALKGTPKIKHNGVSVLNIQSGAAEDEISYEDVTKTIEDIKDALPEMEQELSVFQQLGEALPVILNNPHSEKNQTLVKKSSEQHLWNSVATGLHMKASASAIIQAIQEQCKKKGVVRVLLIGDRNAELSKNLLPHIKAKGMKQELEYTFSASTDSLLQNAQQQLEDFTFVKYKYFDKENGTDEQGLVPGSFDLAICLHALHSTANVNKSMIRRLLCEQGCLLIYEVTKLNYLTELVFFPSLFYQPDDTKNRCLSTNEWKDMMTRNGFVDVFNVAASRECFPSIIAGYNCKNATVASSFSSQDELITIIAEEDYPLAQALEKCFKNSNGVKSCLV